MTTTSGHTRSAAYTLPILEVASPQRAPVAPADASSGPSFRSTLENATRTPEVPKAAPTNRAKDGNLQREQAQGRNTKSTQSATASSDAAPPTTTGSLDKAADDQDDSAEKKAEDAKQANQSPEALLPLPTPANALLPEAAPKQGAVDAKAATEEGLGQVASEDALSAGGRSRRAKLAVDGAVGHVANAASTELADSNAARQNLESTLRTGPTAGLRGGASTPLGADAGKISTSQQAAALAAVAGIQKTDSIVNPLDASLDVASSGVGAAGQVVFKDAAASERIQPIKDGAVGKIDRAPENLRASATVSVQEPAQAKPDLGGATLVTTKAASALPAGANPVQATEPDAAKNAAPTSPVQGALSRSPAATGGGLPDTSLVTAPSTVALAAQRAARDVSKASADSESTLVSDGASLAAVGAAAIGHRVEALPLQDKLQASAAASEAQVVKPLSGVLAEGLGERKGGGGDSQGDGKREPNAQPQALGFSASTNTVLASSTAAAAEAGGPVATPYLATPELQNAELKLSEPGQAPVEVSISMQGNEAHLAFRTDETAIRTALESASNNLRELLQAQGLVLSGVSVGTSGSGQTGDQDQRARQDGQPGKNALNSLAKVEAGGQAPRKSAHTLDLFV